MLTGDMPTSPAAMRSCAPYGIMPCMQHDIVSNIDAHLRLSTLNLSPICFAIPPMVMMATVLFAVQMFTMDTSAAMLSSASRLFFILRVMPLIKT